MYLYVVLYGTSQVSAIWGVCVQRMHKAGGGQAGLHKFWYPTIRDTSTWSKFGAHGEHVFLFSNLGDGSKNLNMRTCEHMILSQLRMGARQAKNAPLRAGEIL